MEMRPPSRIASACWKPVPVSPRRWSSGTKQFSITTSEVSEARMPSLFSFLPGRKPAIPFSRTKAETLRWRGPSGSVTAKTTQTSPTLPWVVKVLAPLSTQPPSTFSARVRVPAASEPAPGSVRLQAPIFSPLRQRHHPAAPLFVAAELEDVVGAQGVVGGDADADRGVDPGDLGDDEDVFDVAEPGAAELFGEEDAEEAELAGLGITSRGNFWLSSYSSTMGSISLRANSRAASRTARCSGVREKSMAGAWVAASVATGMHGHAIAGGGLWQRNLGRHGARRQKAGGEAEGGRGGGKGRGTLGEIAEIDRAAWEAGLGAPAGRAESRPSGAAAVRACYREMYGWFEGTSPRRSARSGCFVPAGHPGRRRSGSPAVAAATTGGEVIVLVPSLRSGTSHDRGDADWTA